MRVGKSLMEEKRMATHDRRDSAGRRSGSRGPAILRFEPLEGRQLLSANTGAAVVDGAKAPDLVAVSFRSDPHGDWGHAIKVGGTLRNDGNADAQNPFKVDVYVSTAPDRSTGAIRMGSIEFEGLKAGEEVTFDRSFDLPPSPVPRVGDDGAVHIGLVVDAGNAVAESHGGNNVDQGVGVDSSIVLIVPHQPANLAIRSVSFGDSTPTWGDTIKVTARVENTLGGHAPASTARVVLTPPGVAVGAGKDVTLIGDLEVPELLPYQSVDVTGYVLLPQGPPRDFPAAGGVIARLIPDAGHDVNPIHAPQPPAGRGIDWEVLSVSPDPDAAPAEPGAARPDLTASEVLTPGATLHWGNSFQVAATVTNQGKTPAGPLQVRFFLAGPNGEMTNALVLGDTILEDGLAAGASQTITQTLKLPGKLPFNIPLGDGVGRIVVHVDPENVIDEADNANNTAFSTPMTLRLPTPQAPDSHLYATRPPALNPDPAPTPNPLPPQTPRPIPAPVTRTDQQQRIQAYRSRLQAFRQQMEQRRLEMSARRMTPPATPPRHPGGTPFRNV